eukprot:TRINITY_DN12831_c1_g1_i1.p1 TRINITY_DN12831_c1_g1~~TRINITY_DN12831_c1_g1_i1.p1  ORF type:complete len:279 (-),score=16.27 TRINITY_DN12831_c1_g1_i1:14-850(-)
MIPLSAAECPTGYNASGLGDPVCFKLFEEPQTREDAIATCAYEGGYLAEIENKDQNDLVARLKLEKKLPWVQLGLTCDKDGEHNCWYWDMNAGTADYSNWDTSQHHQGGSDCRFQHRCVAMGSQIYPAADAWHDCPCDTLCSGDSTLPFVCRISANSTRLRERTCLESPLFTCSEMFASCCPGTKLEVDGRCGDCCPDFGLVIGIPMLICSFSTCVVCFFLLYKQRQHWKQTRMAPGSISSDSWATVPGTVARTVVIGQVVLASQRPGSPSCQIPKKT